MKMRDSSPHFNCSFTAVVLRICYLDEEAHFPRSTAEELDFLPAPTFKYQKLFFCIFWYQFQYCTKSFELQCSENAFLQSIVEKAKFTTINIQRFFGFPIFTQQKIAISAFLTIFLRLTGISKNSRQLEEVFF